MVRITSSSVSPGSPTTNVHERIQLLSFKRPNELRTISLQSGIGEGSDFPPYGRPSVSCFLFQTCSGTDELLLGQRHDEFGEVLDHVGMMVRARQGDMAESRSIDTIMRDRMPSIRCVRASSFASILVVPYLGARPRYEE